MSLRREVVARSKLPHMRRGLFWVQGSWSPEGHGDIPLLFCGSKRRVVIDRGRPWHPRGALQDTWPLRAILPYPLGTHLSGSREDRAAGEQTLEHWTSSTWWGVLCASRACVWGSSPTYLTVHSFRMPFSKTSFLRYFIYYKICKVEVVSSVFTKLCSHHHSLILECLNSPRRNHQSLNPHSPR